MGPGFLLTAGATWLLVAFTALAHGQSQHLAEVVMHAQAAVAQGKQGYPDALVTQAQEALKHAELAKMETAGPHLDEGIRLLRSAIDHGKQGHGDAATEAVEGALAHVSESSKPTARAAQEDSGY